MKHLRKKLSQKINIVMIPQSTGVSRNVSFRISTAVAVLALVAVLVGSNAFFGVSFLESKADSAELLRLQTENAEMSRKYEKLRWDLSDIGKKYEDLVDKEISIRNMFDLPEIDPEQRLLGIGGPSDAPPALDSEISRLAYRDEVEVDRLNRMARFELDKMEEVVEALSGKKRKLDHTPSIRPTRGWISRGIGNKRNPFTGTVQFHAGVDIANHRGTPVVATANGTVAKAGRNGGMGRMISINHGFGYVTRYGHLDKILVKRGAKVKRGDVIGLMGSTGKSTGPHLHYEVTKNRKAQNPLKFVIKSNY
jgi:murein DD-endopeptidase MepM/ murein hydrolase activator NlpD